MKTKTANMATEEWDDFCKKFDKLWPDAGSYALSNNSFDVEVPLAGSEKFCAYDKEYYDHCTMIILEHEDYHYLIKAALAMARIMGRGGTAKEGKIAAYKVLNKCPQQPT